MTERAESFVAVSSTDRASVYQLLSDVFAREMPVDGLLALKAEASRPTDPAADTHHLRPLIECAVQLAPTPEAAESAAKNLAGDYAYLFLGVGGPNGAPPYESVYRDDRGRIYGEPTVAMERELATLNLHILNAFPEPADHIAIELAVAARLAGADFAFDRQTAFLNDRLAGWLSDFAAACAKSDRTGFYAAAAMAAAEFVATDLERLRAVHSLAE